MLLDFVSFAPLVDSHALTVSCFGKPERLLEDLYDPFRNEKDVAKQGKRKKKDQYDTRAPLLFLEIFAQATRQGSVPRRSLGHRIERR